MNVVLSLMRRDQ